MRSTLFTPKRPKCPMCDASGIRQIGRDFFGLPELRCQSCFHQWTGKPQERPTNRTARRVSPDKMED